MLKEYILLAFSKSNDNQQISLPLTYKAFLVIAILFALIKVLTHLVFLLFTMSINFNSNKLRLIDAKNIFTFINI